MLIPMSIRSKQRAEKPSAMRWIKLVRLFSNRSWMLKYLHLLKFPVILWEILIHDAVAFQGMDMRGKQQVIKAQVPLSEMLDYQSRLNSMTQARGSYSMEFSHYDPLPQNLQGNVIKQAEEDGRIRAHDEED